jgi:hypothetical protein
MRGEGRKNMASAEKLSIGKNYTTGVNSLHSTGILICKVGGFTYFTLI